MELINKILSYLNDQILSQILIIIIILLTLLIIYLLIKKSLPVLKKRIKDSEKKEILDIKHKERKIMKKLKKDKIDVEKKIQILNGKTIEPKHYRISKSPKKRSKKLTKNSRREKIKRKLEEWKEQGFKIPERGSLKKK